MNGVMYLALGMFAALAGPPDGDEGTGGRATVDHGQTTMAAAGNTALIQHIACPPDDLMDDAEFAQRLTALGGPPPKRVYSWYWARHGPDHPAVRVPLARALGSITLHYAWGTLNDYRLAAALRQVYGIQVAVVYSPFQGFGRDNWAAFDDRHFAVEAEIRARAALLKSAMYLAGSPDLIMLDAEQWAWEGRSIVQHKYDRVYYLFKHEFPETPILWYDHGERAGYGATPKLYSPVPLDVASDGIFNTSWYELPDFGDCVNRLYWLGELGTEHGATRYGVWVALASSWINDRQSGKHWSNNRDYPVEISYNAGWRLGATSDNGRHFPQKYGPLAQVDYILLWPEVLDPEVCHQREHLLAFLEGLHGK